MSEEDSGIKWKLEKSRRPRGGVGDFILCAMESHGMFSGSEGHALVCF